MLTSALMYLFYRGGAEKNDPIFKQLFSKGKQVFGAKIGHFFNYLRLQEGDEKPSKHVYMRLKVK
jgi:hypothetical protein